MRFYFVILAIAALSSATEACKCLSHGRPPTYITRPCCVASWGKLNQSRINCDGLVGGALVY
ncbi:hypothetical protein J3F84DRAFT_361150 [Trichoderma pleuroticola]